MANTTEITINQFTVNPIIDVPCDSVFLALLPQTVIIKRPYDATEGVKKTNEFGEVILTYPNAQVIGTDIPVRIDPIRQRGEMGLKIRIQGGEVFATFRAFFCPEIDIRENDSIFIGSREYQAILVDELFGQSKMHHREVFCRRIDNL